MWLGSVLFSVSASAVEPSAIGPTLSEAEVEVASTHGRRHRLHRLGNTLTIGSYAVAPAAAIPLFLGERDRSKALVYGSAVIMGLGGGAATTGALLSSFYATRATRLTSRRNNVVAGIAGLVVVTGGVASGALLAREHPNSGLALMYYAPAVGMVLGVVQGRVSRRSEAWAPVVVPTRNGVAVAGVF